jgi:hypothetical protein
MVSFVSMMTMKKVFNFATRTAEVTEAIEKGTLSRFKEKSAKQLKEIVTLVSML